MIASALLNTLTTLFEGESPYGEDINYDSDFDTLKKEIGKVGGIDWGLVETTATSILEKKSKDVRAFSFLSLPLLRDERWEAFVDVFDALSQLASQNFDQLHPARPRARQMALKWLSETRFVDTVAGKKIPEENHEDAVRLVTSLEKLKTVLEEKFPEGSPFPSGLYSAAQKWEKGSTPKPREEPKPTPAAQTTGSGAASSGANSSSAPGEPLETPKDAQTLTRKAALLLIEQEPTRPMGYRLLRSVRWDLLEKEPPVNGGATQLPGPNEQQRKYFEKLAAEGNWTDLRVAAEKAFVAGANHFWLDLQRYSVRAALELGKEYALVPDAIVAETALLLKRLPGLPDLNFSDGSPFCDGGTKDWIARDVSSFLSDEGGGGGAAATDDALTEDREEAGRLATTGKVADALSFLHAKIASSSGRKDRFKRTALLCEILLRGKRPDLAVANLETLCQEIDTYRLDHWEPSLAVETWTILAQAYRTLAASKSSTAQADLLEKRNVLLGKIAIVDPKHAFGIT